MSKIVAGVLPVLFLISVLSAPVVSADSESRRSRPSPDRSERLNRGVSFLSRHLRLRNGKLFLSGSRRSALNAGISEEEFEAFEEAVDKLNDMKDEGYVTFEREKSRVMVHRTEKLEEETGPDRTGSSIMAATPNGGGGGSSDGGKNDFDIDTHKTGLAYQLWLDHYWTQRITDYDVQAVVGVVTVLIAAYSGGLAAGGAIGIAEVMVSAGLGYAADIDEGMG